MPLKEATKEIPEKLQSRAEPSSRKEILEHCEGSRDRDIPCIRQALGIVADEVGDCRATGVVHDTDVSTAR